MAGVDLVPSCGVCVPGDVVPSLLIVVAVMGLGLFVLIVSGRGDRLARASGALAAAALVAGAPVSAALAFSGPRDVRLVCVDAIEAGTYPPQKRTVEGYESVLYCTQLGGHRLAVARDLMTVVGLIGLPLAVVGCARSRSRPAEHAERIEASRERGRRVAARGCDEDRPSADIVDAIGQPVGGDEQD